MSAEAFSTKQRWVCAECQCVIIHRGQAEKEGRGYCLSRGGGAERCLLTVWKYDLRAPASPHGITCDRRAPPPYKSPSLLLFSSSPSSLPFAQYAVSSRGDKNKSNVYCLAVSHLFSSPSSSFVVVSLNVKVIKSQRSTPNVFFHIKQQCLWKTALPLPVGHFVYFYIRHDRSIRLLLPQERIQESLMWRRALLFIISLKQIRLVVNV